MSFYLDPKSLMLQLAPDGTLRALIGDDRCALRVEAIRAMPLSSPDKNIVLRDGGGKEVALLEDLRALDAKSRELIEAALEKRYFLPQIQQIYSIYERFGSAQWDVETDRGRATINSRAMHESVSEIAPNRYLIRDNEENRFEIRDLTQLDAESKLRFAGKF